MAENYNLGYSPLISITPNAPFRFYFWIFPERITNSIFVTFNHFQPIVVLLKIVVRFSIFVVVCICFYYSLV